MGEISRDCVVSKFFDRLSVQDFKIFKEFVKESRDKGFAEGINAERLVQISKSDIIAMVREILTRLVGLGCIEEKHYKRILEDFIYELQHKDGLGR